MIPYIINVALILAGCLAFYKLLLQRETFYRLNRYVLVACVFVAFALPFVRVPQQFSFRKAEVKSETSNVHVPLTQVTIAQQSTATENKPLPNDQSTNNSITITQVIVYLYWFGVIVFGFNFLLQGVVLLYRAYSRPVIIDGKYRIVEVSGDKAPCSFGNNIFINPEKYDWETYNQILMHEKVHISQRHTLDIVMAEVMLILQWFNPFAWIYRKEVENNLEFLTDDQLVQKHDVDRSAYQLSLLKVSTPHFPLSLTTNYNQSLLKKRIVMMNAKKSNVHTAWKYFFLLPVLVLFACLLNEPVAYSQDNDNVKNKNNNENRNKNKHENDLKTEGTFFAVIKGDKINITFKSDEDDHSNNSNTFLLSDISNLPRNGSGTFTMKRDAGTMEFTGKFDGDQGMGRYKFNADKDYAAYMSGELKEPLTDRDVMVFFFVNATRSYMQDLKALGYTGIDKDQLIPLAALNVDKAFISSIKSEGYKDVELEQLIPLKALGVDGAYIREIKGSGYQNISLQQLITFKAQGIDKEYLGKMKAVPGAKGDKGKSDKGDKDKTSTDDGVPDADDIVAYKAMKIDDDYVNSFRAVGLTNLDKQTLVSFKGVGVTPDYVRSMQQAGFRDIPVNTWVSMKAVGVTPDYARSWSLAGYTGVNAEDLVPLKAQHITPDFAKSFESVGFKSIPLHQLIALKSMGVTPDYISSMKAKGFNYTSVQKYITLKSIE